MVARIWNGVIALVVLACFITQIILNMTGGQDASTGAATGPVPTHVWLVRMFSYFTIQSNLLILIATISLTIDPQRDGRLWRVLRLDSLLGIVITGLVFDTILARDVHLTGVAFLVTVGFHYFAPWASLLGWLLFGPRPRIDWTTLALAFIWPVAWIAYTLVRGSITGIYPYPFLNADVLGFPTALRNTLLVLAVGLLLALIFTFLDRLPTLGSASSAVRPHR